MPGKDLLLLDLLHEQKVSIGSKPAHTCGSHRWRLLYLQ